MTVLFSLYLFFKQMSQEFTVSNTFSNLSLFNGVLDINVSLWIGNGVPDANAVTFDQQPVVDDRLNVTIQQARRLVTHFKEDDMSQGSRGCTKGFLTQDTRDEFPVLNEDLKMRFQHFEPRHDKTRGPLVCIAHLIAEDVLKSAVIEEKKFKNIECK